ncbi:hypothetical protein [Ectobacillus ponti]|uniref:Uncharacterized protein n=1 Tax=Ectobacillus ponti TaxID=2961894 RepID=A0AA42BMY4_9BACI|nr:hypothetical protein [Ectobacillus ponti]MCP8967107.1 hypothetical protein [Ectobacillus ponti]
MGKATIMKIKQALRLHGFEDVEYCKQTKQFQFHNNSDIMNNYVTVTYSRHFRRFSVRIHPIETSNPTELAEVAHRLQRCSQAAKQLNAILEDCRSAT